MVGSLSRSGHQLGCGEVEEAERTLLARAKGPRAFLGKPTPQGASKRMGNSGGFDMGEFWETVWEAKR
jgi:hypothetical protein